jgi:DNA-binding XRE family transcriptional regulator
MNHPNYLGAHRKRWALTKTELAHLIGYGSRHSIYVCETSRREPTLRFALACEVVFGLQIRVLFPALYDRVEDVVMERAALLDAALRERQDAWAVRKRELLEFMVERAQPHPGL